MLGGTAALFAAAAAAQSTPAPPAGQVDVNRWLAAHPAIAAAVVWEKPDGAVNAHPEWDTALRDRLQAVFAEIAAGGSPALPAAPPLVPARDPDRPVPRNPELARWSPEVVRDYYLAFVAESLALEIGRRVPWSLTAYTPAELATLLDSRSLFVAEPASGTYRIPFRLGAITPGNPVRIRHFLEDHALIGPTAPETIERVIAWVGRNVVHFSGDWDAENVFAQWQYHGWPPAERILAGTTDSSRPAMGHRHRSGGCVGTVGLLHTMLRTVNIPVELLYPCPGHAIAHFMHEGRYLSHGDDPYDVFMIATPPIPFSALLIDRAQYTEWFGNGADAMSITVCKNIGRRVRELALQHLPHQLLHHRCTERRSGAEHARGQVYEHFRFLYSVQELERQRLWERLDEKIAALGGCDALPPARWE